MILLLGRRRRRTEEEGGCGTRGAVVTQPRPSLAAETKRGRRRFLIAATCARALAVGEIGSHDSFRYRYHNHDVTFDFNSSKTEKEIIMITAAAVAAIARSI